jgi:hypothetical protein
MKHVTAVLAVAACAVFVPSAWGAKSDGPKPTTVPLLVDVPKDVTVPEGWPVTTGVPFRDGQLTEEQIGTQRVETDAGQPIPAQFEVHGRYLPSRAVKWLGVSFQLVPDAQGYRLISGGAAPGHVSPVRVEKAGDGFVVSTGLIRVEIPGVGPVLSKVWMGKELVLEQGPQDGNWLITLDGKRHSEKAEKAVLERQGPLHSTVRVDGQYLDETGKPSCRWTARLHFYAGRPEMGITHTFFWIGRQDKFGIRDLAISFGLKQPAVEAMGDASDDTRGESVTRPVGKGEALSLFQETYWHHGQGVNHFGIFHGLAGREQEIAKGERAGSWIGVRVKSGTVTLGLKDLWQQFPNELEARSDRVTAYLWRTRGKAAPLDLSFSGLENLLGPVLGETYRSQM